MADKLDQAVALMDRIVNRRDSVIRIGIKESGPGVWRVTRNGNILGDSRGYSRPQAEAEARRMAGRTGDGHWEGSTWVDDEFVLDLPRSDARKDATPSVGPVITLELAPGFDNLSGFLEFLSYVKRVAGGGHSFLLAADESADGPGRREFGKQLAGATCSFDGDGSDHIARILVDGEEFK